MAEGEGSSSVEADGPYSRAAYVEAPAIPHYLTLHEKTSAVQQIRILYAQNGWEFTYWHLASFYMSSKEDLTELIGNPEAARKYGDAARLFGTLFTSGRVPSTYKPPVNPAPPPRAAVNLAPPSASIPLDVSPGSSKTRDADEATRGSLKRKSSISSATGSLKKKVTNFVKRAEIFQTWRQPSSSSTDFGLDTSTNTETEPSAPAAPLDKGKRPMTRSAAKAARVLDDINETDSAQTGETARQQESHGQLAATTHSSSVELAATHARRDLETDIDNRDGKECVVTRKAISFDRAHIVPFSVNSTRAGLNYVPPALAIVERLLGVSFRQQVQALVGTLGGSDFTWNVITLTPYLHRLWDFYGLIGFRPRYIDAERGKSGKVVYFATFTFHWLLDNDVTRGDSVPLQLSADDCFQMVSESEKFSTQKDRLFETVYTPGRQPPNDLQRLEDGHVCRVRFSKRREAELMMTMLDLRWHASRLMCLSGAAGEDFLEPASDVDSDSDDCPSYRPRASRLIWGSDDDEAA